MPSSGSPTVTVGMPVYNGEAHLAAALESVCAQSFRDLEIIISDNASTDGTAAICRSYAERDSRIRYVCQPTNIGAVANFKFVIDHASGEYFMWAAADDTFSRDFVELNTRFLADHPDYVASTSPTYFTNSILEGRAPVVFAMDGDVAERFVQFFDNCWISHGIFYSVMRTNVARQCEMIGQSLIAMDWAIDVFLASRGKINRVSGGSATFRGGGASMSANPFGAFRNSTIELFLPFFRITAYTVKLMAPLPFARKLTIWRRLVKVNLIAIIIQLQYARRIFRQTVLATQPLSSGS